MKDIDYVDLVTLLEQEIHYLKSQVYARAASLSEGDKKEQLLDQANSVAGAPLSERVPIPKMESLSYMIYLEQIKVDVQKAQVFVSMAEVAVEPVKSNYIEEAISLVEKSYAEIRLHSEEEFAEEIISIRDKSNQLLRVQAELAMAKSLNQSEIESILKSTERSL